MASLTASKNAAEGGLAGLCFARPAMVGDEQCRQLAGLTDDFTMLFGSPARCLAVAGECTQQFAVGASSASAQPETTSASRAKALEGWPAVLQRHCR